MPTHSTRELVLRCLHSVVAQRPPVYEIFVVDDASADDSVEQIRRRFPEVVVLEQRCRSGFTAAANRGLSACGGDLLVLLNSDTELLPGSLASLCRAFETSSTLGIAGAQLSYPNGEPQWSGGEEPGLLWGFALASGLASSIGRLPGYRRVRPVRGAAGDRRPVEWVSGAALAVRRAAWSQVGPLDDSFRFYCQDLDFCLRARRAGWEVAVVPGYQVVHVHGGTIARDRGGVGPQHPALLWTDLVLWACKSHGRDFARHLRSTLAFGARVRLGWKLLGSAIARGDSRRRRRAEAAAYRDGLRALRSGGPATRC